MQTLVLVTYPVGSVQVGNVAPGVLSLNVSIARLGGGGIADIVGLSPEELVVGGAQEAYGTLVLTYFLDGKGSLRVYLVQGVQADAYQLVTVEQQAFPVQESVMLLPL